MSWEEISKSKTVCPCGKGYIIQNHYGDDWNRYKDGSVIIECEDCAKKYKVEKITHSGMLISDGSWSEYFLLPIDYPKYNGPKESDIYGSVANPNWDFTGWLIENFSEKELVSVAAQLKKVKASSELTGNAATICKEHKSALKTVRVSAILDSVENAIKVYPSYVGNKLQREEIRKSEAAALQSYREEKRKHQIAIDLR